MAVYRIYPEKDTFIFSKPNLAGLYGNAGKDEILEIGGYPDITDAAVGRTDRTLIQFSTSEITSTLTEKVTGAYSASINLHLADASEIPSYFRVFACPVSSSWSEGTGKRDDSPINRTGCTWKFRKAGIEWDSLGGDFITTGSLTGSAQFNLNSDYDLNIDVTNSINSIASSSLTNNGFLLKLENKYENYTTSSIHLKYFGSDTNTIFPPYLEFKWNDSVNAGSLTELSTDIATISIKNQKEEYIDSDKTRFRLSARPKYPTRSFTTSSIYLTNYSLPTSSYWGIKDEYSEEMIIDFDTQYTKLSKDSNGSYFDVYMNSLQPERYYRLLIKTTLNGSDIVIDNRNIFKVVRNG
tara:strand:+ start:2676 stop:3734 length:1059 start_codon:yes stop_codon:yes gene_type:complete